ncbi:MAG: Holliday junction resolvase RuvX [Gammaproteobacteria bacterium]
MNPGTVLAFDFGYKRIGVAVGNATIDSSNPLTTVHTPGTEPNWAELEKLIKEWSPDLILVGLPLMLDDTPSANAKAAEQFGAKLARLSQREVLMVDEKLSSTAAREELKRARQAGLRKRTKPGDIDKFAAQVILRSWLNQRDGRRPESGDE